MTAIAEKERELTYEEAKRIMNKWERALDRVQRLHTEYYELGFLRKRLTLIAGRKDVS